MAISYFGYCNADGSNKAASDNSAFGNWAMRNNNLIFTCPGSGTQNIKDLRAYLKSTAGISGSWSMAIYLAADLTNKICEYTSAQSTTNTSYDWRGVDDTGLTGTKTLVGGTNYILCWTTADTRLSMRYDSGSAGDYRRESAGYIAGWPADISVLNLDYSAPHAIRCGVEAAASGLSVPVIGGLLISGGYPSRVLSMSRTLTAAI